MTKDKQFIKYQQRGDYHSRHISQSIFNFSAFVNHRYHQVLQLIPKNKKIKLLDIGCGEGVLLSLIQQKTKASVVGLDPETKSFNPINNLKIIKGSAYKLPFKSNSFDYVISTEVIEHLARVNKYLSEIKRVLKSSGSAIITTPVKLTSKPKDKMHLKEYTPKELKNLLDQHFRQVALKTSHPVWLKNLYSFSLFKIGKYHFDLFRWFINILAIVFHFNLFMIKTNIY